MYKIGDYVIYGKQGVCEVENVKLLSISGENHNRIYYYTLKPLYDDGFTHTPVDTNVFIRPLTPLKEVKRLIIGIRYLEPVSMERKSTQELTKCYLEFLNDYNCYSLLQLIKSVYEKERLRQLQNKRLGKIDIRYKQEAEELLCQEFSQVLNVPKEHLAEYLNLCMTNSI